MNSAAKLRKRSVATLAASALIIGGIAPAAFAWNLAPASTTANTAGGMSMGLTDTDEAAAGTQGAVAVLPGGSGQAVGEMKFVLPSTWQTGDSIDFVISRGVDGTGNPATVAERVSYGSTPAVTIDATAYDETTHVEDLNSTGAAGTAPDPNAAGSVNGGALTRYTPTGQETPAKAPLYSVQVLSEGENNYENVLRITFNNDSDPAAARAKFIGTINATFDVGTAVTGEIPVVGRSNDNAAAGEAGAPQFVAVAGGAANVTYPAVVQAATLAVQDGSVVADGSPQYVGPFTVQAAAGETLDGGPVTVTMAAPGGSALNVSEAVASYYDATGKLLGTGTVTTTGTTITTTPVANTTRVVFTNVLLTSPTAGAITYSLTDAGGAPLTTSPLGGGAAPTHQFDIMAPTSSTGAASTASPLPDRIGGLDRYQTAVKLAERSEAEQAGGIVGAGESDNVVIASGEGFADALSAGYLAATKDAQLILTRAGSLPQTDVEFLKNYGAKNVFIVGGTGAVSKAVEDQLKALTSYDVKAADGVATPADQVTGAQRVVEPLAAKLTVTRIAGNDRFETNRRVNEYAGATSVNPVGSMTPQFGVARAKTALVANGMAPWDALAAGPLVSRTGDPVTQYPMPIVLTAGSTLNPNAKMQMQTLDVQHALFIGGSGVLPDSLMTEADNLGAYTNRIAGADRWQTAKAIGEFALRDSVGSSTNKFPGLGFAPNNPILANGGSINGDTGSAVAKGAWADALAAGPMAAKAAHVLALTDSTSLPAATTALFKNNTDDLLAPVIAVGLGGVISTETVAAANAALAQ